MLEEGRSYSGYERNTAFLHLGGETARFADVSGASGLDLMDDGRSIAVCDWDYDGREDFWITNRNAPRLRLQHNRSQTANSFVAVKLKGTTCNRDAIGARVELSVTASPSRRIRTLRAGEGFLAQSSSWIHFGIEAGTKIKSLTVRWPGGTKETFSGVKTGKFFIIEQGKGQAKPWQPPVSDKSLADLPVEEAVDPPSQKARVVMASPLVMPESTYLDLAGKRLPVSGNGAPLLINLWATWCPDCETELKEWTQNQEALRKAGFKVLALSVDEPQESFETRVGIVKSFLDERQFPFPAGLADASFLNVLEVAGRATLDKYEPLPVPSSLLLDARGRIAAIYKGPVQTAQIAADATLLGAGDDVRFAAAVHFPGKWIESPWPATPAQVINKFMSFGQAEAAQSYLDRFTIGADQRATEGLSEAYYLVGNELAYQKKYDDALAAFAKAAKLNPSKIQARKSCALFLFRASRFAEALPHLRAVVTALPRDDNTRKMLSMALLQTGDLRNAARHMKYLNSVDPNDAMGKLWYGHVLIRLGQAKEALALLRAAQKLQPNSLLVSNELAWLLATHPDPEIRNAPESLRLAVAAAGATNHRNPRVLDTLAVAQGANSQFKEAVETIDVALALAANDPKLVAELRKRRELYLAGQPYRESFPRQRE